MLNGLLANIYILVVLITGGYNYDYLNTAEIFLPSNGKSCTLPHLPQNRYRHTVDNHILCGGSVGTEDSCLQWSPDNGTWEEYLTLDVIRYWHVSWTPGTGVGTYLMGGDIGRRTTTLVKPGGTQEPGFPIKYDAE